MNRTLKGLVAGAVAVVGLFVVVGLLDGLLPSFNPFSSLFRRETSTATGDVVLKRLKESQTLVAASGSFDVPVVVCNGDPEAFVAAEHRGDVESPSSQILNGCKGLGDEKATLLISAEVQAQLDLEQLDDDAVKVDGNSVTITLPSPTLAEPTVDAERDVLVVGISGSFLPGKLPDDYQARAAGAGKDAVSRVADGSGLRELGENSARSLFEGLLTSLGFTDVTIEFAEPPADPG